MFPTWFVDYVHRSPFFDRYVLPYTLQWRIRRRTARFLNLIKNINQRNLAHKIVPEAGQFSKVLLINFLGGLGDGLYVNGLIRYFVTSGLKVSIASPKKINNIFRTTLSEEAIYDIFSPAARKRMYLKEWDAVIDLSYCVLPRYDIRAEILSSVSGPIIALDPQIRSNPHVCSEYLDISDCGHIGKRWACVANRIIGRNIRCIRPFVGIPPRKTKEPYVYVNTIGSESHKTLTQEQIGWIAEFFDSRKIKAYFYCPQNANLKTTEYVKRVQPSSFADACGWVGAAKAIVTPDTSIVHVATAYEVPQLTFFARNKLGGFGTSALEEFHPISTSVNVLPKKKNLLSKEIVPISAMEKKEMETALSSLMKKISNPKASETVTYINADIEAIESAMGGVNSFNINRLRVVLFPNFVPNSSSFSYLFFLKTLAFLSPHQVVGNEPSFQKGGSL